MKISVKEDAVIKLGMNEESFSVKTDFKFIAEPFITKHWWGQKAHKCGWYESRFNHYYDELPNRFRGDSDDELLIYMKKQYIYTNADLVIKDGKLCIQNKPSIYFQIDKGDYTHLYFDTDKEAEKAYKKWAKKLKLTEIKNV